MRIQRNATSAARAAELRARIADAADAAVCTIFGGSLLNSMQVICNSLDETFTPITWDSLRQSNQAIALL